MFKAALTFKAAICAARAIQGALARSSVKHVPEELWSAGSPSKSPQHLPFPSDAQPQPLTKFIMTVSLTTFDQRKCHVPKVGVPGAFAAESVSSRPEFKNVDLAPMASEGAQQSLTAETDRQAKIACSRLILNRDGY